jgi:hypothetical protein
MRSDLNGQDDLTSGFNQSYSEPPLVLGRLLLLREKTKYNHFGSEGQRDRGEIEAIGPALSPVLFSPTRPFDHEMRPCVH